MHRRLILLSMLTVLAACASHPAATSHQPYLAAPLKDVALKDSMDYWSMDTKSLALGDIGTQPGQGCFRVQVIIDSNGDVFEQKVLGVFGPGMADWLPGFVSHLHYLPGKDNPAKTPIRTSLDFSFAKTVSTVTAATTTAGREAAEKMSMSPEMQESLKQCHGELDKQMGITPAPAAATSK